MGEHHLLKSANIYYILAGYLASFLGISETSLNKSEIGTLIGLRFQQEKKQNNEWNESDTPINVMCVIDKRVGQDKHCERRVREGKR